MSDVSRIRVAAALGLLSVILSIVGLSFHGYPALGVSGKKIAHWANTTNQQQFAIGIYVEALGFCSSFRSPPGSVVWPVMQRMASVG